MQLYGTEEEDTHTHSTCQQISSLTIRKIECDQSYLIKSVLCFLKVYKSIHLYGELKAQQQFVTACLLTKDIFGTQLIFFLAFWAIQVRSWRGEIIKCIKHTTPCLKGLFTPFFLGQKSVSKPSRDRTISSRSATETACAWRRLTRQNSLKSNYTPKFCQLPPSQHI